ncbi:unnamed protein product [Adineta steineri]|uniref:Uncharacterized protein n=1 Tax=Adineta steineri TaxID=433720 RepID=A0A814YLE1_9BILA|nr:unnamed protein product [Adineta steineri]CAF1522022.1 unnamed protein product [Adineta steineri]
MFVCRQLQCFKFKYLLLFVFVTCFTLVIVFFVNRSSSNISLLATGIETIVTSPINTTRHLSKVNSSNCLQSDTRPFFEQEYPQTNLPQRISNSSYQNILHQLHSLRLIVVACARNVEKDIENYRSHVEPIIDLFHPSSRILIFESDSKDKTVEKLYQWPRAQVYAYGNLMKSHPGRTDRLAFCRNTLLSKTRDLKADYILVTDLDAFSTAVPAFLSNFQYNIDDWSVMTTASSGAYSDLWALRTLSDSVMNYDVWRRMGELGGSSGKNHCSPTEIRYLALGIHEKLIPIEYGLLEVRSAFGGAGLYKLNSTYGCQYNGDTCEHVAFHLCIREKNQGRIFINSEFRLN